MLSYFEQNKLLNKAQFGFLPKLSTINAVEKVVNNIYMGLEEKLVTSATLLDLSKAFDTVSHKIMVKKLEHYGFENKSLDLLQSFLSNRLQMVKVNGRSSDLLSITKGVPQGSVLGPFLFVVYVNDLPQYLPCETVLYADDITLILREENEDLVKNRNEVILEMSTNWLAANCLQLNNSKTEEIFFSTTILNKDNSAIKLLGIFVDQKLNWERHITYVSSKLARVTYLLYKLRNSISKNLLLYSYFAYFHTHLMYGVLLWGNATGAKTIFKRQKKAVRCLAGLGPQESCKHYFKELNIITLPGLYIYHCLLYAKENLNDFNLNQSKHLHNTRNKHMIDLPFYRLSKTHKCYKYLSIELFNKLPKKAHSVSFSKFKTALYDWLKNKEFYSIEEFNNCEINDLNF